MIFGYYTSAELPTKVFLDYEKDFERLGDIVDGNKILPGSVAHCIENSKNYMMNSEYKWIEQKGVGYEE